MSDYIQSPFNKVRKDKFIMVIPVPKGLKGMIRKFAHNDLYADPDTFTMSVYGVVAPAISVPSIDNKYAGQSVKVSSHGRTTYPALTVKFAVDNRFNNYWFIYKWLDILNDDKKSIYDSNDIVDVTNLPSKLVNGADVHVGTYSKQLQYYSTNISIFALDEYEKRVAEFVYTGAFPTSLGGIDLTYRDGGEIDITAGFEYSQFAVSLIEQVDSI